MLFALNHIKETMYYWGDNYKMQTSHTLCSRPKRYGALQVKKVRAAGGIKKYEHNHLNALAAILSSPTEVSRRRWSAASSSARSAWGITE